MTSKASSSKPHASPVPRGMVLAFVAVSAVGIAGVVWVSQLMAKNSGDAALSARRERIAAMSIAEKEQLKVKQERFAKLDDGEKTRLRGLYAAIENHPHRAELTRVMMRYRQWLRELTPEDRASLLTTEISKRLAAAQALQEKVHQRYLAEAGKEMSETESRAVKDWMDALIADRLPKALELADGREKDGLRWAIDKQNAGFKRGIVWPMIVSGKLPPVTDEDHLRLAAALSQERRATFEKAKSKDERERVVNAWIMGAMFFRRGGGGPGPSREDLEKELAKLPPEERQRISTLPPEQMQHELRRKWFESRYAHRGGPGERGPGGRDGPPGPPFSPPRPPRDENRDDDGRRGERRGPDRRGDERREEGGRGGRRDDRGRRDEDGQKDRGRPTKTDANPPSTMPSAPEP